MLRGDPADPRLNVLWPLASGLGRSPRVVLVDFTLALLRSDGFVPSFDGFTFQGGDVQVYGETEFDIGGRVSNCVFDMRHMTEEIPEGPYFGSLTASIWDWTSGGVYNTIEMNLINNTFIQGWRFAEGSYGVETARPESVAICDTNFPNPNPPFDDPDLTIRGVADLNIQNNLIRSLPLPAPTAMLGIGFDDSSVAGGIPSNAFRSSEIGGSNGTFASAIVGSSPVPAVDLDVLANDPAFVGEMISQVHADDPVRDFRLLFDASVVGEGVNPIVGECTATITAVNGTMHIEAFREDGWLAEIFDFDGEVHGNPRINGIVDIGFDETDLYCNAGSYGNDSKSHDLPWRAGPFINTGNPTRSLLFPVSRMVVLATTFEMIPLPMIPAWTIMPGTLIAPASLGSPTFFTWLDNAHASFITAPAFVPALTNWTNPESGVVHTFAERRVLHVDNGGGTSGYFFNTQAHLDDPSGATLSSNLQSEYF